MNILLTNDDGYNAPGILILKKKLEKYGNVFVVAPKEQMSAKSVSITLGKGLTFVDHGDSVFSLDGTPADCAEFALTTLETKFDLVISGPNDGHNISYDTMYSGTIGAGMQAIKHRIPVICFSCYDSDFTVLENHFDEVMQFIINNKLLDSSIVLNVNFPIGKTIKGIELGRLHYRKDYTSYFLNKEGKYVATRQIENEKEDLNTDVYQVQHGIVSVVPLDRSFFHESTFNDYLKKLNK